MLNMTVFPVQVGMTNNCFELFSFQVASFNHGLPIRRT